MRTIRVLVVEDSRFFRELLVSGISRDPSLEVVATASDPYEARDAIIKYRPDVMTLDVELPRMNGIEFLKRLIPQYSIPVIVVSAIGSSVFDALDAGAVDFVNKPTTGTSPTQIMQFISVELCSKIRVATTAKLGLKRNTASSPVHFPSSGCIAPDRIVAIGASTGGTEAIFSVVSKFEKDIPGVVIVQHMPPGFTAMYAERLNSQCKVPVKEAHDRDRVIPGQVLIANGAEQMRIKKIGQEYIVECKEGPKVSGHCPSVDVLFESVAKEVKDKAIGVILTGMGADGAHGLLDMKLAGAQTIGQSEKSCVVYGMPKVAYDIGAVKYQLDLEDIPGRIYKLLAESKT